MNRVLSSFLGLLLVASLSVQAQIVITEVGITTGGTMPGSPNDFIFFNSTDYPYGASESTFEYNVDNNGSDGYSKLSSFGIKGGLTGITGTTNYASITTPAGTKLLTGAIDGNSPGAAFALEPGNGTGSNTSDTNLDPNFNYNDFDVYVMISNTNGAFSETTVSLDARSSNQVIPPDSMGTNYGENDVSVTDLTGKTSAQYIEYHVTGLATAIADGYKPDLVVALDYANGGKGAGAGYVGAVSFESLPEPSTWALMLGGAGLLVVAAARRVRA